jgi:hypothetical protein
VLGSAEIVRIAALYPKPKDGHYGYAIRFRRRNSLTVLEGKSTWTDPFSSSELETSVPGSAAMDSGLKLSGQTATRLGPHRSNVRNGTIGG